MTEIVSLPTSLKTQIENAQNLLARSERDERRGDHEGALDYARQGMSALVEIAQRNPEIAASLIAMSMGHKGIEFIQRTTTTRHERVEKKGLFGLTSSSYMVPVTDIQEIRRTIRMI